MVLINGMTSDVDWSITSFAPSLRVLLSPTPPRHGVGTITYTPQIGYRVAICPRRNLPYIQIYPKKHF